MVNRFQARLQAQKMASVGFAEPLISKPLEEAASEEEGCSGAQNQDEPLSPDEIGYYLTKLETKQQVMLPTTEKNSLVFESLQAFVTWFSNHKSQFSPSQQTALNTLDIALQKINYGCSCRRDARVSMSNQYYKTFFIKNSETDIIKNIKSIAQVDLLIFKLDGQEFLRSDTPKI